MRLVESAGRGRVEVHTWHDLAHSLEHFVVVNESQVVLVHLLDALLLLEDELFLFDDVPFNVFEEQIRGLAPLLLQLVNLLKEGFDGLGLVDLNVICLALVKQVRKPAFRVLAALDLVGIGEVEHLLALV